MRLDQYSNPIYNEQDLFDALYKGHSKSLSNITVDSSIEIDALEAVAEIKFSKFHELDVTVSDYDQAMQSDWHMPEEYYIFNVEQYCLDKCTTEIERQRVHEELAAFNEHNMDRLLQWLKYFVDTCTREDILWGIGRGSSVASYVLFLLGVHNIDSIKYNLDWREFLR